MNRSELLNALADDYPNLRTDEIKHVVDVFFEVIAQRLAEKGRVELRGFGTFATRVRVAHSNRIPKTGESIDVPATRLPHFHAGKKLRACINRSE